MSEHGPQPGPPSWPWRPAPAPRPQHGSAGGPGPLPPWSGPQPPPQYPRQDLLPHQVTPPRSRRPLLLGLGAVLLVLVVGVTVFLVTRDDGENTRAAYCSGLRDLTRDGDLGAAVTAADASTLDDVRAVRELAPPVVADDWEKLEAAVTSAQSGSPDVSTVLEAFGALKAIARDAQHNCDLTLDIPLG